MPDITMCDNSTCTLKEHCYRHTATPNPLRQSWSRFYQVKGACAHFIQNFNQQRDRDEHKKVKGNP